MNPAKNLWSTLSQRQQQQNTEDLQLLKTTVLAPSSSSQNGMSTGGKMAALTAVSKLASRIKKKEENGEYEDKRMTSQSSMTPASITTNNTTDTVSAAVNNASLAFQRRSADKSNTRALEMIIETLKADVQRLTEEKDVLLREKKSWSIKIQDDNLKLAKMLKEIKGTKEQLLKEIDSVSKEGDRLRAMRVDVQQDALLQGMERDSLLSPARRSQLPAPLRMPAAELHDILMTLVTRCRGNIADLWQHISSRVQEIERYFADQRDDDLEIALAALKNIASSSPANIQSAEAIAKSLSESMIHALLEKSMESLQRMIAAPPSSTGAVSSESIENESTIASNATIRQLMAANETLKASNKQLRKRNNELRSKVAVAQLHSDRGTSGNTGSTMRRVSSARSDATSEKSENQSDRSDRDEEFDDLDEDDDASAPLRKFNPGSNASDVGSTRDGTHTPRSGTIGDGTNSNDDDDASVVDMDTLPLPMQMEAKFDNLREDLKALAEQTLLGHVAQMMDGHPLGSDMKPSLLREAANEIARQTRGMLGNALVALLDREDIILPLNGGPETTSSAMAEEIIQKLLQSAGMHMEIVALVTMTLTYLYARTNAQPGPQRNERLKSDTTSAIIEESSKNVGSLPQPSPTTGAVANAYISQLKSQTQPAPASPSAATPKSGGRISRGPSQSSTTTTALTNAPISAKSNSRTSGDDSTSLAASPFLSGNKKDSNPRYMKAKR